LQNIISWGSVLLVADVAMALGVTIHAILWKRDSRSVIAWVGLAWLAPLLGTCAYICFGINRIQRKANALKRKNPKHDGLDPRLSEAHLQQVEQFLEHYPSLAGLAMAGRNLTERALVAGNRVEALVNGDEAYPRMIAAIDQAQQSVSLLSYIFDSDRSGEAFFAALVAAHERGVAVRVLVDDIGSKYSRPNMVRRLRKAGVTAAAFLPTRIPLPRYANLRNHRKILVVDGSLGFTGGTNIREGHQLSLNPKHPVQCLHFELQGPIVSQLQAVFATDWSFTTGEQLHGESWFPEQPLVGDVWARGIEDGPDEDFEKLSDLIVAALASARHRVRIVTPYFLPNASLIQALNVAALRGVAVEIYLPAANNIAVVQWAAMAQLGQLLEKGCRVHCTPPPFDHTKLMVVDDMWSFIGSTNWDPRSLRLNFEFNVECYDLKLARELNALIDAKATEAREVTLAEVHRRGLLVRLRDGAARLLTPYL